MSSRTQPDYRVRVAPEDLGTLLVCSVRYSIGRRTYMPHLVAGLVRQHWVDLEEGTRRTLARDVAEAIADADRGYGSLGDACDDDTWRALHAWMGRGGDHG